MEKTIYLYVKESPKGLKYLGITSKENPYYYKGSGKYWTSHLRKHNIKTKNIKTTILLQTSDRSIISFWGMYYSKIYNVVESEEWANLIPESGELSTLGSKHSDKTKLKIGCKSKLYKRSKEHINSLIKSRIGSKNSAFQKEQVSLANKGKIVSAETRLKLKIANHGKKLCESAYENSAKVRRKPVIQYDLQGNFIKEWNSAKFAGKELNISKSGITACCKQQHKTAGGFKWEYKNK